MRRGAFGVGAIWVVAMLTVPPVSSQQVTLRLRGKTLTESGTPVDRASLRAEAIAGIQGNQFVGQKHLTGRTNAKGEWSLLGVSRGVWVFQAIADGHFPQVVTIPVEMMAASQLSTPRWIVVHTLQPMADAAPAGGAETGWANTLVAAAEDALAGRREEAAGKVEALLESKLTAPALCAAGDIALFVAHTRLARQHFTRAIDDRPDWYRPHLGLGTAAMIEGDFDTVVKAFARARELTSNGDLQRMLSASLDDLRKITRSVP